MLTCEDCGCRSESGRGWIALLADHREEEGCSRVATYCPPCAARAHGSVPRLPDYI